MQKPNHPSATLVPNTLVRYIFNRKLFNRKHCNAMMQKKQQLDVVNSQVADEPIAASISEADRLEYMADMIDEMRQIAIDESHDMLSELLRMARDEARSRSRQLT